MYVNHVYSPNLSIRSLCPRFLVLGLLLHFWHWYAKQFMKYKK